MAITSASGATYAQEYIFIASDSKSSTISTIIANIARTSKPTPPFCASSPEKSLLMCADGRVRDRLHRSGHVSGPIRSPSRAPARAAARFRPFSFPVQCFPRHSRPVYFPVIPGSDRESKSKTGIRNVNHQKNYSCPSIVSYRLKRVVLRENDGLLRKKRCFQEIIDPEIRSSGHLKRTLES